MEEIIQIQTKFSNIYEFYRENGVKKMREIDFENYFYVKSNDLDAVLDVIIPESRDRDFETKLGYTSIYGEKLCKIIPNKYEFWKFRKALKAQGIQTYEAWLDINLKYLLENPKKFSDQRKVGVIDIENDGSLDCLNAPKPITSICLYDYALDKYIIWIIKNPKGDQILPRENPKEELRIFDKEKDMMQDFCDVFRDLDYDICGGWNSNNFDWPYIINRLKVLGINPEDLSNFGEVETRGYKIKGRWNFNSEIRGVELIDFIPVLKKNTCYKPQPASFSLESTANFFLDTKKLTDIGWDTWKTRINDFITYNIRDVELVKQIIDKFKLIEFLMVIQTEIVPVPLNNTTHNSVVLLHYLKHHFKDAIIPDNTGKVKIENNGEEHNVNLTDSHIRIKAAHVIPAHPGIHESVSVFDFAGLYPSIIRTFNICPSTINDSEGAKIDDIAMWQMSGAAGEDLKGDNVGNVLNEWTFEKYFKTTKKGIYPIILEDLTNRRNEHKHKLPELAEKYGKTSSEYLLSAYRSDVLKQISNSLYGVNAFNRFPLFNPWVAAAITSISRKSIMKCEKWLTEEYGYEVVTGDTDSVMVKHPKEVDPKVLGEELNDKMKEWITADFNINPNFYCMELEYEKTFNTFVMKDAKKKYYGFLSDGSFQAKGFSIIQHVLSDEIKEMIKKIYIMLLEKKPTREVRDEMLKIKKDFNKLPYDKLTKDLKIAKNLEEYDGDIQHIRGARYSNKHLGTDFKGGSVGKLLFIKQTTDAVKYPMTDVVLLDEDTKLPDELKIDYEILWEKLFITNIRQLESIKEMNIERVVNPNTELGDFF